MDMVRSTACYSISFDECMNRISQNEQMDFIIRYWDGNTNKVAVRYIVSEFLGHATAVDLLIIIIIYNICIAPYNTIL